VLLVKVDSKEVLVIQEIKDSREVQEQLVIKAVKVQQVLLEQQEVKDSREVQEI
jgi:hypothetical protein